MESMKKNTIFILLFVLSVLINLFAIGVLLIYAHHYNIPFNIGSLFKRTSDNLVLNRDTRDIFVRPYIVDREYGSDSFRIFPEKEYLYAERNKVKINNEIRNAFIILLSGEIETAIEIEEPCYLDFGIHLLGKRLDMGHRVKFTLYVEDEKDNHRLCTKLLKYDGVENKEWYDFRIDLSQFLGKKIDILFKFEKADVIPLEDINITDKYTKIILSEPMLYPKLGNKHLPNIVFVSIDTLRQDHLGVYGYFRNTTPNIDQLAKEKQSIIFDNVISQSNWTLPSHMSMFTSQYASVHEIFRDRKLQKDAIMLPKILRNNGFLTSAFTTHVRVSHKYGFERGFDYFYFDEHDFSKSKATVQDIIQRSVKILEKHRNEQMFLFIHLFDVHDPYDPPPPFDNIFENKYEGNVSGYDARLFAKPFDNIFAEAKNELSEEDLHQLVSLYDGEIRNVDFHLGILFDNMKKIGLYDNTLIIITSDHGEEFKEHGGMIHNTLYNEVISIPLIIKMPKGIKVLNNRIEDELIQGSIDIAPTILEILKIEIPDGFQGKSLFPLIKGRKTKDSLPYQISERLCDWDLDNYQIALFDGRFKYIYTTFFDIEELINFKKNNERFELYDLYSDKGELNNLAKVTGKKSVLHSNIIDKFIAKNIFIDKAKLHSVKLTKEQKEKLKSLGYIK